MNKRMRYLHAIFLLGVLGVGACDKKESGETQAPASSVAVSAPTQPPSDASAASQETTTGDTVAQKSGESPDAVEEQVAETDEGTESNEEPAPKNSTPQLKLAQIPPRAVAGSRFKEGVHYLRLSPTQPVNVSPDQVQIVEFFWYGCPHCNALDPRLEAWRTGTQPGSKPDYVVFTRVPGAWNEIARRHGRFYFAAESLGKLDELHPLIFREIHERGNPLDTIESARKFFASHGVDEQAFQKHFGALSIDRKLDDANMLAQRHRITGVPMFAVNGKFTTDVQMAGGEEQLLSLLNELAAREHEKQ
jgi:protein dithiol oxidoreductase (disulfide-forming)